MSDKVGNLWVVEHYVVLSPEFWLQKLGRVNGGFEASRIIKRNKGLSRLSHPVGSTPSSRLTAEDVTIIRQSPLLLASVSYVSRTGNRHIPALISQLVAV